LDRPPPSAVATEAVSGRATGTASSGRAVSDLSEPYMQESPYRADIDGLRAVAVLLVVGFHLFPKECPGGFIGVDVFFVISGYLISGIIFRGLQNADFSFGGFYSRRARRILPALILVLVFTYAVGWWVLLPDEYDRLSKHIASAAGFVSNFTLWNESGYFDADAYQKPLVHLWSLAIEEQFYILWPVTLALAWKRKWNIPLVIFLIATVSFAANVAIVGGNPTEAFYSPACRFWELMAGALLGYRTSDQPGLPSKLSNALGFCGLAAIIVSAVFLLDSWQSFPGWWALLPTIGTLCVIKAQGSVINRFVLSNRLPVGIGLISYPLYLWHWPLLVYSKLVIRYGDWYLADPRKITLLSSFCFAFLTYVLVETPIRRQPPIKAAGPLAAVLAVILIFGGSSFYLGGLPRMRDETISRILAASIDWSYPGTLEKITAGNLRRVFLYRSNLPTKTLLIGDSHVEQYLPRVTNVIDENPDRTNSAIFAGNQDNYCGPWERLFTHDENYCYGAFKDLRTLALADTTEAVVLTYRGSRMVMMMQSTAGRTNLARFISLLIGNGKRVYLILMNPEGDELDPRHMLVGSRLSKLEMKPKDQITFDLNAFRVKYGKTQDDLRTLAVANGATAIDPFETFCNGGTCPVLDAAGDALYADSNHPRNSYVRASASFIDATLVPNSIGTGKSSQIFEK
jgi:peptidoglycan/LPS O-acetylase OafA/YrhL